MGLVAGGMQPQRAEPRVAGYNGTRPGVLGYNATGVESSNWVYAVTGSMPYIWQ